jgi:hypothetical protein
VDVIAADEEKAGRAPASQSVHGRQSRAAAEYRRNGRIDNCAPAVRSLLVL